VSGGPAAAGGHLDRAAAGASHTAAFPSTKLRPSGLTLTGQATDSLAAQL